MENKLKKDLAILAIAGGLSFGFFQIKNGNYLLGFGGSLFAVAGVRYKHRVEQLENEIASMPYQILEIKLS